MIDIKNYAANYLTRAVKVASEHRKNAVVTMQFFQRTSQVVLCGINDVLSLISQVITKDKISVKYLPEGTILSPLDVVLEITGHYQHFGFLEGVFDGILARQSSIATHAAVVKKAALNKTVIFMGDRADLYLNQSADGHAAYVGGVVTQVTPAQTSTFGGVPVGTMPHALIQLFGGDLISALSAYRTTFPNEDLVALVDFNNDVVTDSLKALAHFGKELKAVRIDTGANLIDKVFNDEKIEHHGVNPDLVKILRAELDKHQGEHVKIIVSSGLSAEKVAFFEAQKAPVDVYGVGKWMLEVDLNFTADLVKLDGQDLAKFGRKWRQMRSEAKTFKW